MTESQQIAICPHCRKSYSVLPKHIGQTTQCRQCHQSFTVTLVQPPSITPPAPSPSDPSANVLLCPVCQSPVAPQDAIENCPACHTPHHKDCWDYNRGCGLYGCKQAPETDKLQDIEIPSSYWGQTEKQCPNCQQKIQAAAVRCRYCGANFDTARPQATAEFMAQIGQKKAAAIHQRFGIVLLIFAILPCTAPLAAVVGLIWYFIARREIAALPPLQATICRLAVGIATVVTLLMTILGVIFSSVH